MNNFQPVHVEVLLPEEYWFTALEGEQDYLDELATVPSFVKDTGALEGQRMVFKIDEWKPEHEQQVLDIVTKYKQLNSKEPEVIT